MTFAKDQQCDAALLPWDDFVQMRSIVHRLSNAVSMPAVVRHDLAACMQTILDRAEAYRADTPKLTPASDAATDHIFQVSITVRADNRRLADEMLQTELETMMLAQGTHVENFTIHVAPDTLPTGDLTVNPYQHTLNRIKGLSLDTYVTVHLMGGGTVQGKVGETSHDDVLVLSTAEEIDLLYGRITYCEIHAANIVAVEDRMVVKGS